MPIRQATRTGTIAEIWSSWSSAFSDLMQKNIKQVIGALLKPAILPQNPFFLIRQNMLKKIFCNYDKYIKSTTWIPYIDI